MNAVTKQTAQKAVHKSIYAALAAAQSEMGPAIKDSNNPAFRSKYADLGNVVEACMPALNANGIAVIQPPYDDDTGRYVKTIFLHGETGEVLECRVPLIVGKNDMQGYGSAVTYARRYGLMAMAGIAPEDDDGNAAAKAAPKQEAPAPKHQALGAPEDNEAQFEKAVSEAVTIASKAPDMASLGSFWSSICAEQKGVASDPRVIAAKDARKAQLAQPRPLEDDEIPY